MDLGIAKLLRPDAATETLQLTRFGQQILTPEFAAPEQLRGEPAAPSDSNRRGGDGGGTTRRVGDRPLRSPGREAQSAAHLAALVARRAVDRVPHRRRSFEDPTAPGRRRPGSGARGSWIGYSGAENRVVLVSPDGGETRELFRADGWLSGPAWSTDGGTLYVHTQLGKRIEFWAVPIEGDARKLFAAGGENLFFSREIIAADAERLFFTMQRREGDLWSMPVEWR